MRTKKLPTKSNGSQVHKVAITGEAISIPLSRRARLMGTSAIAGRAWRGFAIAAGMVTVFGAAPMLVPTQAAAQFVCGGSATGAEPQTGAGATAGGGGVACGTNANASDPTFGQQTAVGDQATATGSQSVALGAS